MRKWLILFLLILVGCGARPALRLSVLPGGHAAALAVVPWQIYPGMPTGADRVEYYEIYKDYRNNEVGHMIVAQYNNDYWRGKAYDAALAEMEVMSTARPVDGFAAQAMSTGPADGWRNSDVVFVRCNAIIHITMPVPELDLIAYAEQLGEDVETAFC